MAARLPDSGGIIFSQVPYLRLNDLRAIVLAIREDLEPEGPKARDLPVTQTKDTPAVRNCDR